MLTPSRRRTIILRDGARATLRPIAPEDGPLLVAAFKRLSEESRYRRFFTTKSELSATELAYFVDVDHKDHEAIIAIEPSSGEALGVARYIRLRDDEEVAEVAVTVVDDWQRRGLGRALLDRLTYHARREGVRRFSALVQGDNPKALGLLGGAGGTLHQSDTGVVELVIELPPKRGMGAQLTRALRATAAGSLVPAKALAERVAVAVEPSPRPPVQPVRPIRTIVVGADGSETGRKALVVALQLAATLGTALHVVSAYGVLQAPSDAEAVLTAATRAARAEGPEAITHARRDDPAEALIAVAEEQDADLWSSAARACAARRDSFWAACRTRSPTTHPAASSSCAPTSTRPYVTAARASGRDAAQWVSQTSCRDESQLAITQIAMTETVRTAGFHIPLLGLSRPMKHESLRGRR